MEKENNETKKEPININTFIELAKKYKEKYELNFIDSTNEEINELLDSIYNSKQNKDKFEENNKNINFVFLLKSHKYMPMAFLGLPTTIFILGNLYVLYKRYKNNKISNFLEDNETLFQRLWREIQKKFIEIIEQDLFANNFRNNVYNFYDEEQIKEMSYFFKYICLENKHLIKQINFNIYNILLIGKTNVGKSTLINEFLGLKKGENNFAEEGTGCPTPTINFKEYFGKRNNVCYNLYDTNGIQLGGNHNIENSLKEFENGIKDNLINCIWYCISGSCVEEKETDLIRNLINIYSEKEILPIIIIHTKSYDEEESNLVKNHLLKDDNLKNKMIYIPILARKKILGSGINQFDFKSFGLDELEKSTKEQIETKSKNSALSSKLRDIYKILVNKIMNNKIVNSAQKIYNIYFKEGEELNFKEMENIIINFFDLIKCKIKSDSRTIYKIFKKLKKINEIKLNSISFKRK